MNSLLSNKYLLLIIRFTIGFVFVYAGAEKISNPNEFSVSILNYRLFPIILLNCPAITLPWIEIISGILLIFGVAVKENSTIIFSLLLFFSLAIVISLLRGLDFDCGCFGKGTQIGLMKLGENLLMLAGSFLLIVYGSDFLKLKLE